MHVCAFRLKYTHPMSRRLGVLARQLGAVPAAPPLGAGVGRSDTAAGASAPGGGRILEGVTVIELATVVAAPSACALLADFGATVIKVETPEGDMWRGEARTIRPAGEGKDT